MSPNRRPAARGPEFPRRIGTGRVDQGIYPERKRLTASVRPISGIVAAFSLEGAAQEL